MFLKVSAQTDHFKLEIHLEGCLDPFPSATRIQRVKKWFCNFLLLIVDEDKRTLLFKTKSCFLYRMEWCIHLDTLGHYESRFNRIYFAFLSVIVQDLSKYSTLVMQNINKNIRFFVRLQFLNDDSERETYHLLLTSQ